MLKKWFHRLTQIASSRFGASKEDGLTLEGSLTKFERFFHFWVLVCRSFVRNRCPVRASSLSYTTLLAMIPVLAVAISITNVFLESKGEAQIRMFIEEFVERMVPSAPPLASTASLDAIQFRMDEARAQTDGAVLVGATNAANSNNLMLGTELAAGLAATNSPATNTTPLLAVVGTPQVKLSVSKEAANYIYDFAEKSSSTALGVTGAFFLVLTAILTLTRVEETFNDIWGVTRGREWWSRITNYFFTIVFGPVLIFGAVGLANSPNFQKTRDLINIVPFIEPLLSTYFPVLLICFAFALIYKIMPNTKVDFSAALTGGSLAGLAWYGYNHLGFLLASSAVKASAVYGRLAILPLFMGGLYVVWLTVLFGAQVAYAFQNRASYLQDQLAENVNQRGREFVALRLMTCIGQRFHHGLPPVTIRDISTELGVPGKLAQQVMRTLLAAGLVVEVTGAEAGYSPARPLETINCHHILLAMRATHGQEPATRDEPVRVEVLGEFARIQEAEKSAASSVTMLALVNRAQARLELAAPTVLSKDVATPTAGPTAVVTHLTDGAKLPMSQPTSPQSISSPPPKVATNEKKSFPL